jgi:multisubunit Na+/H+ antiporter MnhB subunit
VRIAGLLPIAILAGFVALVAGAGVAVVLIFRSRQRKAREAGYPSLIAYLRAAPQTDEEKRDAADLALKGLVLCLLGLLFPPLLLFGLIPFFYGTRKVIYASMGLGLADDPDQQGR